MMPVGSAAMMARTVTSWLLEWWGGRQAPGGRLVDRAEELGVRLGDDVVVGPLLDLAQDLVLRHLEEERLRQKATASFRLQTGVRVKYIDQVEGTASGVVADVAGLLKTIALAPKGRVILSTGALVSPGLLMYSGIGPEETLANLSSAAFTPYNESNWVVNPSVGEGLFDNPNTFIELTGPSIQSYETETTKC